jgi:hypothetical protein
MAMVTDAEIGPPTLAARSPVPRPASPLVPFRVASHAGGALQKQPAARMRLSCAHTAQPRVRVVLLFSCARRTHTENTFREARPDYSGCPSRCTKFPNAQDFYLSRFHLSREAFASKKIMVYRRRKFGHLAYCRS